MRPASAQLATARAGLARRVSGGELPAVAVGVLREGEILWLEAFGVRDSSNRESATIHTPFPLGSLSKSLSASALVLALDRHGMRLDEPVERLFSPPLQPLVVPRAETKPLTARHLLDCRAGIPHGWITAASGETNDPRLARALRTRAFPPGDRLEYSNLSFGVVDELLASLSGQDVATTVRELLFDPLGMRNSGSSLEVRAAATPHSERLEAIADGGRFLPTGGGGYFASASDLLRFAAFHLGHHRRDLFEASGMVEMRRPPEGESPDFRLGWWGDRDKQVSNGQITGASSSLTLLHRPGVAVVVLVNRSGFDGLADRIASEIEDSVGASGPDPDAGRRRWAADHEQPLDRHPELQGLWRGTLLDATASRRIELELATSPATSALRIGGQVASLSHVEISIDGAVRFGSPGPFAVPDEPEGVAGRTFGTLAISGSRLRGYVSFRYADADGFGQATPWLVDLGKE